MPAIKARELKRRFETMDARDVHDHLTEALREGHLRPEDFSLKDLAENLIPDGREFVQACGPQKSGGLNLMEAGHAINTAQFANITGQIVYSKVMEAFNNEAYVFSGIIPNVPTNLNGEKIPGVGRIGDEAEVVAEGRDYPLVGLNEDYIQTPATVKRGMIAPVTKEAIFFDRTNLVLKSAGEVGEWLGLNKEKRLIDCVVDENTTAHRYNWRGTVIATYGDNSGTHTWDNLQASNALEDWTDINAAELLLAAMLDPNTGEPIMAMADTIIVTPENEANAMRIINATMLNFHVGGYATSGNLSQTVAGNPVGRGGSNYSARYQIVSSRLLPARMATDTTWYLGNPRKAFAYMENWPVTVTTAPANSEDEFKRDIVAQYKASERGAAATMEPRLMVKNTVA